MSADNFTDMFRRAFSVVLAVGALVASAASASPLVDLVEKTSPSVVAVGTFDPLKSPRFTFRGTGFVVADGNQVVTNAHVMPPLGELTSSERLAVLVPRAGSTPDLRMARKRADDPAHDLALIDIEGQPLPAVTLADGVRPKAGMSVALIGFPLGTSLGFTQVTHRGIVSAVTVIALPPPTARQLDQLTLARLRQGAFEILQLDATAYPGNSGSPLLDTESGQVLGIINMVYVKSTKESAVGQPTGITYAIPVRHVLDLLGKR
jgi:S1-C subfamily serine protease